MTATPHPTFEGYAYGGVRALVELHDRHLRSFVVTWERARAGGVTLPSSEDPDCASLDTLLRHVLGAARGYLVWTCEVLGLEDPDVAPVPQDVGRDPGAYLAHLLARWDGPLRGVDHRTADRSEHPSRWGVTYCVDAMLEHAVMHPIRHERQLERAREAQAER